MDKKKSVLLVVLILLAALVIYMQLETYEKPEIVRQNISPANATLFNQNNLSLIPEEKIGRPYRFQVRFLTAEFDAEKYLGKHPDDIALKQIYGAGVNSPPTYIVEIFTDSLNADIPGIE